MPGTVIKVQGNDRNPLTLDVLPDIQFRPMEERVNADVGAGREISLELTPEFRRLVRRAPLHPLIARGEVPLLGSGRFLVAADANDDAGIFSLLDEVLQGVLLERGTTLDASGPTGWKGEAGCQRRVVAGDNESQIPIADDCVAIFDHRGNLVRGIDV